MTKREKDLVRYTLAYLATGDGRKARASLPTAHGRLGHLSKRDMTEARKLANLYRGRIWQRLAKTMMSGTL